MSKSRKQPHWSRQLSTRQRDDASLAKVGLHFTKGPAGFFRLTGNEKDSNKEELSHNGRTPKN